MAEDWLFGTSLAAGSQLFQLRPDGTTAVTAYAGGGNLRAEFKRIVVCNTSGANRTFRLCHDDDGGVFDESTALEWDRTVEAHQALTLTSEEPYGGFVVSKNGTLGVRSDATSGLTFTGYGVVQSVR